MVIQEIQEIRKWQEIIKEKINLKQWKNKPAE